MKSFYLVGNRNLYVLSEDVLTESFVMYQIGENNRLLEKSTCFPRVRLKPRTDQASSAVVNTYTNPDPMDLVISSWIRPDHGPTKNGGHPELDPGSGASLIISAYLMNVINL